MRAPARMADALLRGVGGRTVLLRIPQPATQGDLGEQLGLAVPGFQDSELAPAVFRRVRSTVGADAVRCELLVSAPAVEKLVGSLAFNSAGLLFASAAGVVLDGTLYRITSALSAEAFGEIYLYRLGLESSATSVL